MQPLELARGLSDFRCHVIDPKGALIELLVQARLELEHSMSEGADSPLAVEPGSPLRSAVAQRYSNGTSTGIDTMTPLSPPQPVQGQIVAQAVAAALDHLALTNNFHYTEQQQQQQQQQQQRRQQAGQDAEWEQVTADSFAEALSPQDLRTGLGLGPDAEEGCPPFQVKQKFTMHISENYKTSFENLCVQTDDGSDRNSRQRTAELLAKRQRMQHALASAQARSPLASSRSPSMRAPSPEVTALEQRMVQLEARLSRQEGATSPVRMMTHTDAYTQGWGATPARPAPDWGGQNRSLWAPAPAVTSARLSPNRSFSIRAELAADRSRRAQQLR